MTLKEIKGEIIHMLENTDVGELSAINGSIDRFVSDIEARKLAAPCSMQIDIRECQQLCGLAFFVTDKIFSVECVYRNDLDGRIPCDFSFEEEKRITLPVTPGTLSFTVIYYPILERFGNYPDDYTPALPDSILSLLPYYVVSDIAMYDESSVSSMAMKKYQAGVETLENKYNLSRSDIDSVYRQETSRTVFSFPSHSESGSDTDFSEIKSHIEALRCEINESVDKKADGLELDENDGMWYLTSDGRKIAGPFDFGSTGGSVTRLSLRYELWSSKTAAKGSPLSLSFSWSSIKNSLPTGNGVVTVSVNSKVTLIKSIPQGNVSIVIED